MHTTIGGSVLKGENPLMGAIRELREDTGLTVNELKELKRIADDGHHSLYNVF
ncbi:MAG: NUDIX domain-containing protein [Candidatus Avispirillum sp.]